MECFVMNSRRIIMATGTAALLAVATISTASAQGQERARTNAGPSGANVSAGSQMNAQGPSQGSGVRSQFQGSAGNQGQFQGSPGARNQAQFQGSNREGRNLNRNAMGNERSERFARGRDNDRFVSGRDRDYGRDRSRFASSTRYADRDRFVSARYRDRDRFASRYGDRDRFATTTTATSTGWGGGGWGGSGWGGGGWGWGGPTVGVAVGGGWPGYYDAGYGYGYGYPGLYSYSPGFVGVGVGGGCSCGPGWWR
jgi:hypothetical protein